MSNINIENFDTVIIKYTDTFEEYDNLLSENIVLVDLFDASANNTVLECIIRNTPILINKLPAVVEYLGLDYPLYFNNLNEIDNLLEEKNIIKSHEYLKNMDKSKFELNYFASKIINIMYDHKDEINNKEINQKMPTLNNLLEKKNIIKSKEYLKNMKKLNLN